MTAAPRRRGITRAAVLAMIAMVAILAVALVVAGWGLLALGSDRLPVETPGVPFAVAPLLVLLGVALLVWIGWRVALDLLRGRTIAPLGAALLAGAGGYLAWAGPGTLLGLGPHDAWLSWFPVVIALAWVSAVLLLWALLFRQVYTDRELPRWPWERPRG